MKSLSIRSRIIIPFIIIVMFILGISIFLFSRHVQNYIDTDFQTRKENVMQSFHREIDTESKILNGFIQLIKSNKELQAEWFEENREELFKSAESLNRYLFQSFDITHFYFHKPDKTCFLRMHNSERYGDYIDRFTMDKAVKKKTVTSGIELGSYGTFTLRVISPWEIDGKLVGYIELGKEIGNITDKFNNILDLEFIFSISKEFLNREKWEEGLEMTGSTGIWEQFPKHVIIGNSLTHISGFNKYIDQVHDDHLNIIIDFTSDDKYYRLGFIDALDTSMQSVGDIIVIKDVTEQRNYLIRTLIFLTGSVFLVVISGFILLWILLGRIQTYLDTANGNLILKIKELGISKNEAIEAKSIAENANRMKNNFLANISHELRTPLNGILGMTNLLLNTGLDEDQQDFLQMIVESGDNLFRIISDLLDFSQIETGNLTIKPSLFDLSKLVKNTISVLKPAADKKSIGLSYSIIPKVIHFYGDRVRIGQIIINLVTNAIKFSEMGNIRVTLVLSDNLEISIHDTGIGIAEDKIHTIFDSFVQIENTYTKSHEGVGLGLSIVKQLVELLNGTISVESREGIGSTFKIYLPIIMAPADEMIISEPSLTEIQNTLEGLKVIIAEDEAINRLYLNKFLSKHGVIVTEAVNGKDVLEEVGQEEYDLILMDMGMPEIDGIEATKRIRESEISTGGHILIIALTANAYPEDVSMCIEAGMDHFLSKPVKEKELLSVIQEMINSSIT